MTRQEWLARVQELAEEIETLRTELAFVEGVDIGDDPEDEKLGQADDALEEAASRLGAAGDLLQEYLDAREERVHKDAEEE